MSTARSPVLTDGVRAVAVPLLWGAALAQPLLYTLLAAPLIWLHTWPAHTSDLLPLAAWPDWLSWPGLTDASLPWIVRYGLAATVYSLLLGALLVLYLHAVRSAAQPTGLPVCRPALVGAALSGLALLLHPVLLSQDVFSYLFYGRMTALYGANPYRATPADFGFDPLFHYVFWRGQPSNYGPLWTWLSAGLALLGGANVGLLVMLFRLLALACHLVNIALIWSLLAPYGAARRAQGTLLYAWHPLPLIEAAGSAHNDLLMVTLLLLALWLHQRGRPAGALLALTLSALTKYVTVLLLPIYGWLLLRQRQPLRPLLLRGLLPAAGLTLAVAGPWLGPESLGVLHFGTAPAAFKNSLLERPYRALRVLLGDPPAVAWGPLGFTPYWAEVAVGFRAGDHEAVVPAGRSLLVIGLGADGWVPVYDPTTGRVDQAPLALLQPAPPPPEQFAHWPARSLPLPYGPGTTPAAALANRLIRAAGGLLLLALWTVAAWRARDLERLWLGGTLVFLGSYYVFFTWFYPWYITWGLALAVLVAHRRAGRLLIALGWSALLVYILEGLDWTAEYRDLRDGGLVLVFLLPGLVLLPWSQLGRWRPRVRAHPAMLVGTGLAVLVLLWPARSLAARPPEPDQGISHSESEQAWSLWRRGHWHGALWYFNRVLASDPGQAAARLGRALASLQLRDRVALSELRALARAFPDNPQVLSALAAAEEWQENFAAAEDLYTRLSSLQPEAAWIYQRRAFVRYRRWDLAGSRRDLQRALALSPNWRDPYLLLGDVAAAAGDWSTALTAYTVAIELDPADPEAYLRRARLAAVLDRRAQAIADYLASARRQADVGAIEAARLAILRLRSSR